jgi:hypothetical protein
VPLPAETKRGSERRSDASAVGSCSGHWVPKSVAPSVPGAYPHGAFVLCPASAMAAFSVATPSELSV